MCGILCIDNVSSIELKATFLLNKIKHRGPDASNSATVDNIYIGFNRLSINDTSDKGNQPFVTKNNTYTICNGEIYNHKDLKTTFDIETKSDSDCEIIGHLYDIFNTNICNYLDGVFAFCVVKNGNIFAARDPYGIRPLYYGYSRCNSIMFASEAKAIMTECSYVKHFPPGFTWSNYTFHQYFSCIPKQVSMFNPLNIKSMLIDAVKKRLLSDVPIGFFLSGGLDSSLIAAIGRQLLNKKITTFSIGFDKSSPDLVYARKMANFLESDHHEVIVNFENAKNCLTDVVYHLETFDCTTIRASVPMFMLSKYIRENTSIKVLLSGEGADEIFGGYLYLHGAPTTDAFNEETISLMSNIHKFDVLRSDRCTAAHGLEIRVPFLDKTFSQYVMGLPGDVKKHKIEKFILRNAFNNFIPHEILWRQKNAFSDAVGYNWITKLKKYTDTIINQVYEYDNTETNPVSKEESYYKHIFDSMYDKITIDQIWRPKWTNETDPSATQLSYFNNNGEQ